MKSIQLSAFSLWHYIVDVSPCNLQSTRELFSRAFKKYPEQSQVLSLLKLYDLGPDIHNLLVTSVALSKDTGNLIQDCCTDSSDSGLHRFAQPFRPTNLLGLDAVDDDLRRQDTQGLSQL